MTDAAYMAKALRIAERGRGQTSPNPMVGALVVDREGVVVGRGAHEFAGGPHAEVVALREAGARAREATLYCTLEPCCHTGRTGPCVPVVADAGIARVVVAMEDPNPSVNGGGLASLRQRGIEVSTGTLRDLAERQNRAFVTTMRLGRPLVILKVALSLEGSVAASGGVAARAGVRTKLTGPDADRFIHRQRAEVDALAVGSGTILADDPLLTVRGVYRARPLTRVIFDTRLRTPPTAQVLSTLGAGPVIIVSTQQACTEWSDKARVLSAAGADIEALPDRNLETAVRALARRGVTSVVLEGGPTLHQAALDARVVDVVQVYLTPRAIGPDSVGWLEEGRFTLDDLRDRRTTVLGGDVLVEGHVHRTD